MYIFMMKGSGMIGSLGGFGRSSMFWDSYLSGACPIRFHTASEIALLQQTGKRLIFLIAINLLVMTLPCS
jgi:hypothetical protein